MAITNNPASLCLFLVKKQQPGSKLLSNIKKYQKVLTMIVGSIFFYFSFFFFSTTPVVKNCHILAGIYIIFLKKMS